MGCHVQCENVTLSEFEERAAIVNGYNAPNRPFYVELRIWKSKFLGKYGLCGGTIITKQHVLSAAHCFADGYQSVDVYVKDFSNPNSKKTTIPAARVYYNSGYTGKPKYYNDVAVLKLSQSVSSSKVLPMCTKSYSQYTIAVCGMGLIKANSDDLANRLQETQQRPKPFSLMLRRLLRTRVPSHIKWPAQMCLRNSQLRFQQLQRRWDLHSCLGLRLLDKSTFIIILILINTF